MPDELTGDQKREILAFLLERRADHALERYREMTGADADAAGKFIRNLAARLEGEHAEQFTGPSRQLGFQTIFSIGIIIFSIICSLIIIVLLMNR